jgi:hypothetical protein
VAAQERLTCLKLVKSFFSINGANSGKFLDESNLCLAFYYYQYVSMSDVVEQDSILRRTFYCVLH